MKNLVRRVEDLFEEQALKVPENLAIICNDNKITYRELNEKSNQLAHYLKKLELKKKN